MSFGTNIVDISTITPTTTNNPSKSGVKEDSEMDTVDAEETLVANIAAKMIDIVEDFLWCKNVDLRNMEPRKEGEEDAIIYGRDYQDLFSDFFELLLGLM